MLLLKTNHLNDDEVQSTHSNNDNTDDDDSNDNPNEM